MKNCDELFCSCMFQVGMVTYSTTARVEFALDTHQSLSDLQQAILDIPYRGGFTATAWALSFAKVMLTPTDYGARQHPSMSHTSFMTHMSCCTLSLPSKCSSHKHGTLNTNKDHRTCI